MNRIADTFRRLHQRLLSRPGTAALAVFTAAALAFNPYATEILNASYAASGFPVPYYEAQLSFSAEALKGWYAQLVAGGTLQAYIQTQHIDSLFILSTLLLHVGALALAARLFPAGTRGRSLMVTAALVSAIAPIADQAENLVSYGMLANPAGFADGLALVYSGFASLKFAMFVFAYLALTVGVLAAAVRFVMRRRAMGLASCTR
jgi:hypothetical protein